MSVQTPKFKVQTVDLQRGVMCVFKTRFKPDLTRVMSELGYFINKIEQAFTLNSSSRVVQAQDTLQIHWPQCAMKSYF